MTTTTPPPAPLIGPLTAAEWAEFRHQDDDDLLQCCGVTSDVRDTVFALLRNGGGLEFRGIFAAAYVDMLDHDLPTGRGGELLAKLRAFYFADTTDDELRKRVARIRARTDSDDSVPATAALQPDHQPQRGDQVAVWLKVSRDDYPRGTTEWTALDNLLDAYRMHADVGEPLSIPTHSLGPNAGPDAASSDVDPCPQGDPSCETGDDGSCHDGCEPPAVEAAAPAAPTLADQLVVGSVWREKKPPNVVPRWLDRHRRLVEVTDPGSSYATGSRIVGISSWQELVDGSWVAGDWPGNRRRTTILRHDFLRRFEHLQAPEADRG